MRKTTWVNLRVSALGYIIVVVPIAHQTEGYLVWWSLVLVNKRGQNWGGPIRRYASREEAMKEREYLYDIHEILVAEQKARRERKKLK